MALIGKVVSLTGVAYLVSDNGLKRELKLGDSIQTGDTIQTPPGVEVELELANGRIIHIAPNQIVAFTDELSAIFAPDDTDSALNLATIDTVIKALEEGKDISEVLEETAAGLNPNFNSYGFSFVELLRITDVLNDFRFAYSVDSGTALNGEVLAGDDKNYFQVAEIDTSPATALNNSPIAFARSFGRDEGPFILSSNLGATDADGDSLTYTQLSPPVAGLVINSDGSFTFDYNDTAYDRLSVGSPPEIINVQYQVTDGKGGVANAVITITITGTNDGPVATTDTVSVTEDLAVSGNLIANDNDLDDLDVLVISNYTVSGMPSPIAAGTLTLIPGIGSIQIDGNGDYTFTPVANYSGPVPSVTYTLNDGNGGTASGSLDLGPVMPVNDAPTITVTANDFIEDGAGTVAGAVAATYNLKDLDFDMLTVTFTGASNAAGYYLLDTANGEVKLTQEGADWVNAGNLLPPVNLTVTDDGSPVATDSDSATPGVTLVNDAPVGTDNTITINEDGSHTFTAADFGFTDPDDTPADSLAAVIITTVPGVGTLTLDGIAVTAGQSIPVANLGTLVYTPVAEANGAGYADITFQVVDNGGTANGGENTDQSANTITIDVTEVNDAPTITVTANDFIEDGAGTVAGAVAATYNLKDLDFDMLTVTFTGASNAAGYYLLDTANGEVKLTQEGADWVNAGNLLPPVNLTVTDDGSPVATDSDSATPGVTLVNDAPVGTDNTITINEDGSHTFTAADFGFTDPDDTPADSLAAVIITTVPGVGTLTLDGIAVTAGQSIPVANLGTLVYTPVAEANGAGYADITFQVVDNGGTANGGENTDQSANTITIDVTEVNDAPTITVTANDFIEDGAGTVAGAVAATYNLKDLDFDMLTVTFTGASNAAGYYLLDTANGEVKLTQEGADWVNAGNLLPPVNLTVTDDGSPVATDSDSATPGVTLVNDAPVGTDNTITINEDGSHTFTAADFGFTDPDDTPADSLAAVIITTVPGVGTLTLDGIAVTAGQSIPVANLGTLVYTPVAEANGAGYADITFQVVDNGGTANGGENTDQSANTITIDVTEVNDAPTITVTANDFIEDGAGTVAGAVAATYNLKDLDFDMLTVTFTGASNAAGYYLLDTANGEVKLTQEGADWVNAGNLLPPVNLTVTDDGSPVATDSDSATPGVTLVNDAPVGTDNTITINEDGSHTFTAADFGFTDPDDTPADSLAAVIITTVPGVGTLTLDGIAVTAGQSIPVANLGTLVYTPVAEANGAGYADITFQVVDNGGTANGGENTDQSANTITIDVTEVNDAPTITVTANDFIEDGAGTVAGAVAATYNLKDLDFDMLTVTFTGASNAAGYYLLDTANGEVKLTQEGADWVNAGNLLPPVNLTVTDDGSPVATDSDSATPGVTLVNDAPVGTDNTITINEDGSHTFTAADFGFTDPDDTPADSLAAVIITTVPGVGTLTLDGIAVTAGQSIPVANLGTLVYTPVAEANGAGYADITFQVVDNGGTANGGENTDQSANTITIDVTEVNDAPTITVTANDFIEDGAGTVAGAVAATYNLKDLDFDMLTVTFTGASNAAGYYLLDTANGEVKLTQEGADWVNAGNLLPPVNLTVTDDGSPVATDSDSATPGVTLVNDAPVGTDNTITINEDGSHTFTAADFGFTDPDDTPADSLAAVIITTVPGVGTLTLDGIAVTAGQSIPVANLGTLVYTPVAEANGAGYADITFQVVDNGGTANGGENTDQSANTITIDVTEVNDAPTITVTANDFIEDGAGTVAGAVAATYNLKDLDFDMLTVTFTGASNAAGYYLLDTANGEVKLTQEGADWVNAGNLLPPVNLTVTDDGSPVATDSDSATPGVTLVNDAPVGTDNTITINEDGSHTFTAADFGFTDPDDTPADSLAAVIITTVPGVGTLTLDGIAVTAGQSIPVANLGTLVYTPVAEANGAGYADITFQVVDNGGTANGGENTDQSANTITIDVTEVNDAPTITVTANDFIEDGAGTVAGAVAATYNLKDLDFDMLTVTFTGASNAAGYYLLDTANGEVKLTQEGADWVNAGNLLPPVNLTVTDDGSPVATDSDSATPGVTLVNDAPVGTDNTITINEDGSHTFTAADFGFTDPDDTPADSLAAVIITTVPGVGTLTLDGIAVTAGQSIPVANLGTLVYTPVAEANGAGYADITFQVVDNGGTANGGENTDQSANTITIDVTEVNDAPTITVTANDFIEDGAGTVAGAVAATYNLKDLDFDMLTVTFTGASNAAGYYLLDTANGEVKLTQEGADWVNAGNLLPPVNLTVTDDGSPVATDSDSATPGVTLVNDAPVGTDNTITINEDGSHTFTAADFGFTDPDDTPADSLAAVIITTVPGVGTLTLDGIAVTAGQSIPVANLGTLVYTPVAEANGAGYADITFQVVDNGGTANGGENTDQSANTITIDVTEVNDAPTITVTANDFIEDGAGTVAGAVAATYNLKDLDFDMLTVTFTGASNAAGYYLLDTANGEVKLTQEGADWVNAGNLLPPVNLTVTDDGSPVATDSDSATPGVTLVNDAPVGTDNTITINEDGSHTFTAADFGFTDPDDTPADSLAAVIITTVPGVGTLTLDGIAVTAGQSIPVANLGTLVYTPVAEANGAGYADITFQVVDNGGTANGGENTDQSANTITIDVTEVNDAPTITVTANDFIEDGAGTVAGAVAATYNLKDLDFDMLTVTFTGASNAAGYYLLDTANGEVKLTQEGADWVNAGNLLPPVNLTVTDDGSPVATDSDSATPGVTLVNDAPVGTDNTITINEDGSHTFTAADFGFTDPDDTPADSLAAVIITTVPGVGTLTLDGIAVTAGQSIPVANLGTLVYTPVAEANGAGYADITFQVVDNGGTANGGENTDQSANTITIDVTEVNDAPVAVADTNAGDAVTESGVNPGNTAFAGDTSATGNVLTNDTDVDTGDTKAVSAVNGVAGNVGAVITGTYGTVTIAANGTYTYTLNNADTDTNALAQGATASDVFSYTMRDTTGATSTANLTISITGTNDGPVAVVDNDSVALLSGTSTSGNVLNNDTDVDVGDTKEVIAVTGGSVGGSTNGIYGTLTLNSDGSYAYTLNAFGLGLGLLGASDTFTYTMRDGNGAISTTTLNIKVTGANQAPTVVADTASAQEDTTLTASGNVLGNDSDPNGDTLQVSQVKGLSGNVGNPVAGTYGSVTIAANGSYTYTLTNGAANVQALAANQTVYDSFTYTASDGNGGTTNSTLTITITGTNDAPNIDDATVAIDENLANGSAVTNVSDSFTGTDFDRDGNAITYSITGGNASGAFAINAATGAITVANASLLDFETTQSFALTVTASDGTLSDTAVVTVNLNNLNDNAPNIVDATVAINENLANGSAVTNVSDSFTGTDFDRDGNAITYSITGGNASGAFAINAATGAITVANASLLDFETAQSFALTVTASDGTLSDTAVVTVNLNNLDEVAPTITSGAVATAINENSGAGQTVYTATATDSGDISAGVTYSLSGTDAGLFSINSATGAVTLTANPNFETKASYSFNVLASDGVNAATSKAVTLAVNNLDEVAPTITSGAVATAINENSGAGQTVYTATATDSGDISAGVTYSLSGTDAGLFSINSATGAVTLTANPNFETKASYSFNVLASDGVNAATSKAVTLAVNNLDEVAPTITSGAVATAINENSGAGQTVYTATATDSGDISAGVTYSLSGTDAGLFSINSATGAVTLTANPNFETKASYSFNVLASDGVNAATSKAVTLAVNNLDEVAPTITSGAVATAINENSGAGQTVYTATATDSGDISAGVTYSLSGTDAGLFSINSATGAVTLTANPNFETKASYSFNVLASDGVNAATSKAVTLAVNNLDEVAPTITSGAVATAINENSGAGQTVYTATATDSGDISAGVTYSLSGTDAGLFSINSATGAVTLTANPNFETKASYSFNVLASDGVNAATSKAVTLAVNNLDEVAPTITSGAVATAINENSGAGQTVYTATATDSGDISAGVTYSLSGTDAGLFSINSATGAVTLTANPNFETKASYSFNVLASDGVNAATSKAVTLAVNNLDEVAPTITSGAVATAINENSGAGQTVYTATATDSGDISAGVTYSLSGTDAGLFSINSATGAVTLTANPNFETKASYSFNVLASDGVNAATSKAVTLAVNNLDEVAPTITSGAVATAINENSGAGQTVYTATATDSGDISAGVTYSLSGTDAGLFSINSATGAVTLTANPNFETKASYSFNVLASDGVNAATSKAVTLAVNNLDEVAPTITSGAVATAINENSGAGQTVYTATATDSGDISAGVTYSLSGTDAGLFSINSATGAVTLTANPNFETKASYSFNVLASDGVNAATSKAVTLAVNNLDEVAPTITSGAVATAINENSGAGQTVYTATATDSGDISAGVTYSLSGTDAGLFSINSATGAVTLTANPNFETKASYSFNVLASDGVNAATSKAVTLAVNNVNEAPVNTVPASYTVNEDTALKLSGLSVADVDASTGNITVTLSVQSGNGTISATSVGSVSVSDSGTSSIILTGTLANINAYLANTTNQPSYTPASNASGTVELTMLTSDQGNSGTGGALTDSDTVNITINPISDPISDPGSVSVVVGTVINNTIDLSGADGSVLNGKNSYTYGNGVTVSSGNGSNFNWTGGNTLGVEGGGSSNRIEGNESVVFGFPAGMQYVSLGVKNAADDTIKLTAGLEIPDLSSTGTITGQITSSLVTPSASKVQISLVLQFTDGTSTTTTATVSSGGSWTLTYSTGGKTIDSANIIALVDGDLFSQGGGNAGLTTFNISTDMKSFAIAQDTARTYSTGDNNNGFQIANVTPNASITGTSFAYPIDLYALNPDPSETITSLKLSDLPADTVSLSVVLANGSYIELNPVGGIYDLSAYTSLLSSTTGTAGTDKIFLTTGTALTAGFSPTMSVETVDGSTTSITTLGGSASSTHTGGSGNDYINAGAGNDTVNGGAGDDILVGGSGDDSIIGGSGNDTMDGGTGVDVFKYQLTDKGASGTPAIDTITNFGAVSGTDKLDLRDLLSGEAANTSSLQNYLHFEKSGADTIIHVSSTGGFSADSHNVGTVYTGANEDQRIVLTATDLIGTNTNDAQIIASLLAAQKLITD